MKNTGLQAFRFLEEYYLDTGLPTGRIKANTPADADYLPPIPNYEACPIAGDVEIPEGTGFLTVTYNTFPGIDADVDVNGTLYPGTNYPPTFEVKEGNNYISLLLFNGSGFTINAVVKANGNTILNIGPGILNSFNGSRHLTALWTKQAGIDYEVIFEVLINS